MDKESNIGLARIRYETNANISQSYSNQFISVHAESIGNNELRNNSRTV